MLASSLRLVPRRASRPILSLSRPLACRHSSTDAPASEGPLAGIKVLEMGQLIAGPYCGQLLAHFGAQVIKLEPPGVGDPLRVWRELDAEDGVSPWFRSLARNKRSVTCDLRQEEGRAIARKLAEKSDVLIEKCMQRSLCQRRGRVADPLWLHRAQLQARHPREVGNGARRPLRQEPLAHLHENIGLRPDWTYARGAWLCCRL